MTKKKLTLKQLIRILEERARFGPQWATLDNLGVPRPSRRKGSHGYYTQILKDPKDLRISNSYLRRNLSLVTDIGKGSNELKDEFNKLYKNQIKRPTTQGSVSAYLSRLDILGLVTKDEKAHTYTLAPGVAEIINDDEALYQRANARRLYLLDLINKAIDQDAKVV
jgi:hypothetical protein